MRQAAVKNSSASPLTADQVKAIRTGTGVSAITFARHLWVSPRLVENWESGKTSPKGCALVLLHLVKNKGLEDIA